MERSASQVERFVARVHRRMLALRLLEAAGVGMLLSAGLAVVLMGVRMYRGEEAMSVGLIVLGLGAVGGFVWRAVRRPSRLEAAMEADRQLELQDLLSSAWMIVETGRAELDFGGAVIGLAEEQCGKVRAGDVVLRRLGARWWGSVGLAGSLVVAVGLISVNPMETHGGGAVALGEKEAAEERVEAMRRNNPGRSGRRMGEDFPGGKDEVIEPGRDREDIAAREGEGGRGLGEAANVRGAGSGAGRTPGNQANAIGSIKGEGDGSGKESAAGTGSSPKAGERGDGLGGGVVSGVRDGSSVSPQREAQWSAARGRADAEIRSGRIPGEYHELIREYFAREQ